MEGGVSEGRGQEEEGRRRPEMNNTNDALFQQLIVALKGEVFEKIG